MDKNEVKDHPSFDNFDHNNTYSIHKDKLRHPAIITSFKPTTITLRNLVTSVENTLVSSINFQLGQLQSFLILHRGTSKKTTKNSGITRGAKKAYRSRDRQRGSLASERRTLI